MLHNAVVRANPSDAGPQRLAVVGDDATPGGDGRGLPFSAYRLARRPEFLRKPCAAMKREIPKR
jgi:hypothetical protein